MEPGLGTESSATFQPDYNLDDFGLTTWTLNGRLANLELIYTGGRLDRSVDALIDYIHYNNGGGYITYYLCSGNIYDLSDPNHCFDPGKWYLEDTRNRRTTHEFRIHTAQDRRVRLLGGVYYNDIETNTSAISTTALPIEPSVSTPTTTTTTIAAMVSWSATLRCRPTA